MANNNLTFSARVLTNAVTFHQYQDESALLRSLGADVNEALASARLALTNEGLDGGAEALTIISVKKDKTVQFDLSKLSIGGEALAPETIANLYGSANWKSAEEKLKLACASWNDQRETTAEAKKTAWAFLPNTDTLVSAYRDFEEGFDRSGLDEAWNIFFTNLGMDNVKDVAVKKFLDRIVGTTFTGRKGQSKDGTNVFKQASPEVIRKDMFSTLATYLESGYKTRQRDDKGNLVMETKKNGKEGVKVGTFGGKYAYVLNEETNKTEYVTKASLEAKKAEAEAQAVA